MPKQHLRRWYSPSEEGGPVHALPRRVVNVGDELRAPADPPAAHVDADRAVAVRAGGGHLVIQRSCVAGLRWRSWPPTQRASHHKLHRASLENPICGKDLGLPGPSKVSCKRGNPSYFARLFSSLSPELLGE